jgi:DNA-binding NtrC family response regulator
VLESALLFDRQSGPPPSLLAEALHVCGLRAITSNSEPELFELLDRFSPECLVALFGPCPQEELLHVAKQIRTVDHHCSLLVLTESISAEFAVRAMRTGVSDVLPQNATRTQFVEAITCLVACHCNCRRYDPAPADHTERGTLVGGGAAMTRVRDQVLRISAAEANVLITGESGTGKDLVARMIHSQSRRRTHPFVAVNCAALPDSLLESELFGYERGAFTGAHTSHQGKLQHATGGTLFLDEIGEMSMGAQAKILRAVDNRVFQKLGSNVDTRVQVRLVAATNQHLEDLVQEKKFRQDLYYRLNVVRLTLPPLRERLEDIPELVDCIMRDLNSQQSVPACTLEGDVIRRLQQYDWPGNIRELRNVLESILVFSSSRSISVGDIPAQIRHQIKSKPPQADERSKILSALCSAHWNRNEAAKILCCSRMTLYRKMERYRIAD